jgi:NADH-quinone oxidoreductase subunit G
VVHTDSPKVVESRKTMLQFLLSNHPLDCPVCDKGGECELQDMSFRYGFAESQFVEIKQHTDEKQWSPMVYYDAPRCILCYRCVRVCDEGLGVSALGLTHRGVRSEIVPNFNDHLECDECGWCIDVCPVGALTSGTYRYQSRPWEMEHIGTVCAHCADGCKTTLAVRNGQILRANNRDRSGLNGEFLCTKGRFGFDFVGSSERLQSPLVRRDGKLEPAGWNEALDLVAAKFSAARQAGATIGVVGSTRLTNEESYFLQKFARQGLGTPHIDHRRSGDVASLLAALKGRPGALATTEDLYNTPAALVIGADLAQQHPFLAYQLRANFRHHNSSTYTITAGPVREDNYAARSLRAEPGRELDQLEALRSELAKHGRLAVLFGDCVQGEGVSRLVAFGDSLGIPVQYVCLVDRSNSRGAADMGVTPDLGPGYRQAEKSGMALAGMLADPSLGLLWVAGADPLDKAALAAAGAFVVVQDLFLTATAARADVVLPSASAYEKTGTVTNVCGEIQRLKPGPAVMGVKSDLEIMGLIAKRMGLDLGIWTPDKVLDEIRREVPGYAVSPAALAAGGAAPTSPACDAAPPARPGAIASAGDTLFTGGTLARHSAMLAKPMEAPGALYQAREAVAASD